MVVLPAPDGAEKITALPVGLEGIENLFLDYYFLSLDAFKARIAAEDLVEWEEVYPGKLYGTLKSELNRLWDKGKTVVFDVDVVGGLGNFMER